MSTTQTFTTSYPAPFTGTDEQRAANRQTHIFFYDLEEAARCMDCDSRAGSVSADYPCGEEVPRVTITT